MKALRLPTRVSTVAYFVRFRGPRILFKDQDKVMIEDVFLSLQGFHPGVKKGDGVRVFIEIPRDVIQDSRFTAIVH